MNAVNLIPGDYRRRQAGVSASPVTLGVIGGLVVVLAAAVLYVFAVNDVRARKSELARVTANATSWQAAASSYTPYVTAAQQQKQQLTDVDQLVTGRFPWSLLLSQIGSVLPANAGLTSLQATAPSADAAAAATTTSTAGAAGPTPTTQPVQIAGCAASESAVAATMVALGRVHGVSSVSLASTSDGGSTSSSGSSDGGSSPSGGSSSSGGGCGFPVTFSLTLNLTSATSSSGSSSTTAIASSPTTTPASSPTSAGATPTASSTATPSTGSAQ